MITLICLAIVFVYGLILTINPKYGINPNKLKQGVTYEAAVKRNKTIGIIIIIASGIFFLFELL